ncbi:orotate phosphoribosyltransferase [Nocardia nova]|uniref:Orotate phosphoribosyltransferase n=1 Tax=Nocardia nova TaxID=37330 RepID=A0A2S6APX7_9NOCA|nr:orotate phosphoribosyltransferase [Nocardia nova]PPJ19752.1 orotate phosphoribosyltransferase [Nocardia nova]PPJ37270.1 orotate phosphoribosyltransferase [Nocardia nova]
MLPTSLIARIRTAALQRGKFTLSSGEVLDEYFDQYELAADPVLLHDVAGALARELPRRIDCVVGVALGGVPLAVALSAVAKIRTSFYRPAPKTYGTCRQIEANDLNGSRVVVVDDVVRSGTQILHAAEILGEAGATVIAAVCVLDRELGGRERLERRGIELRSLLTPATLFGIERERSAS